MYINFINKIFETSEDEISLVNIKLNVLRSVQKMGIDIKHRKNKMSCNKQPEAKCKFTNRRKFQYSEEMKETYVGVKITNDENHKIEL